MFSRIFTQTRHLRAQRALSVLLCLTALLLFLGCPVEENEWEDDHTLNSALIGHWRVSGTSDYGDWYDDYVVTASTITHDMGYGESTYDIEYVYNFNEAKTAGGIIVKYPPNKYTAVWFKDLQPTTSVLLGDAYDAVHTYGEPDYINDVSATTLAEAKEKFKPANAAQYGGGSAQSGNPQIWTTTP